MNKIIPPTPRQIETLESYGVSEAEIADLNIQTASIRISNLINKWNNGNINNQKNN